MTKEVELEWLRKRMDAILLVLLESSLGGSDSSNRKIEKLLQLGFSNPEVAQITGEKANYVRTVASRRKKKGKTMEKKKATS